MRIDMPGVGGSLGECVACGKSFALEVMLGRNITTVRMEMFPLPLPIHDSCADELQSISDLYVNDPDSWKHLPEGPLRQEFQRAIDEAKGKAKC